MHREHVTFHVVHNLLHVNMEANGCQACSTRRADGENVHSHVVQHLVQMWIGRRVGVQYAERTRASACDTASDTCECEASECEA